MLHNGQKIWASIHNLLIIGHCYMFVDAMYDNVDNNEDQFQWVEKCNCNIVRLIEIRMHFRYKKEKINSDHLNKQRFYHLYNGETIIICLGYDTSLTINNIFHFSNNNNNSIPKTSHNFSLKYIPTCKTFLTYVKIESKTSFQLKH